jgi:hypothetical protein
MTHVANAAPPVPPPVAILQLLTGKWVSQAISVAAELGIADHLAAGPRNIAELALSAESDPGSLERLLRALASVGVFEQDESGRFANTALSDALRAKVPGSMRAMSIFFGDHPTWDAWGELLYSVRNGKSAFQQVHGELPFQFWPKHPRAASYFNDAMTGFSAQEVAAIHRAFDFSQVETLVDIGGGHGALLCSSLQRNRSQYGVLFDLPHVIASAAPVVAGADVGTRCQLVAGNFFEQVPVGDGYILKHILHDWKDEDAVAILRAIRRVAPEGSRVFVMEAVMRPGNQPDFAKLMDLEMLVLYDGGRERTQADFTQLFNAAGFKLTRVVPTDSPASVLEAVPV